PQHHFLFMAHIVYSFGTPPEMTPRIRKILEIIRADSRDIANPPLDSAVALAANIAVQLQDAELANDVADLCVEKSATNADRAAVYKCVFRLLECSQADTDRTVENQPRPMARISGFPDSGRVSNPRPARADILAFESGGGGETWRRKASNSLIRV
ncbi:MAG: hypothetical protein ACXW3U_16985, partial [Rhodoplanes sp.]